MNKPLYRNFSGELMVRYMKFSLDGRGGQVQGKVSCYGDHGQSRSRGSRASATRRSEVPRYSIGPEDFCVDILHALCMCQDDGCVEKAALTTEVDIGSGQDEWSKMC